MLTVYGFFIMEAKCKYVVCAPQASISIKQVVFQPAHLVISNILRAAIAKVRQL